PAAVAAGAAAREAGFEGRILMIAEEPETPYRRPPLSKEYLAGELDAAALPVRSSEFLDEHGIELMLGTRVVRIDERAGEVVLGDGGRIAYGKLVLATGGRPRRLPGVEHERVVYLRTVADADLLAKRLRRGTPLAVLGAGFIGCEVAACARKLGVEVTLLEMADVPLQRVLGDRFGAIIGDVHRDAGVDLRTGERVESVTPTGDGLLVTTDRGRIECGLLLVATGLLPNVELAEGTGIRCANGILVDEHCRTSAPDVFAAGDVAAHLHPLHNGHIRVEHYDNALKQGAVAGRNLVAPDPQPYAEPHWFWSDVYEHNLQVLGLPQPDAEVVVRGSLDDRRFSAWTLTRDGTIAAVLTMNRAKDIVAAKRLMARRTPVTPDALRDESTDLRQLSRT
ncbi:MAG TPA: FAD-dependent oxidoreductase, partial [Actinophytocola sp.]|uniref:NAD(P)/FAD-dependent oxidoreductase n=1 Tax=Actinophytocola sp. TaxID=1872138 RepID=UPI002DDCA8F5